MTEHRHTIHVVPPPFRLSLYWRVKTPQNSYQYIQYEFLLE